jgi:DNA-directed RNA polymerase subunit H (RpoH/RPB5)
MDAPVIDILFRSRKTLLKILEEKGYDTAPYEKFSPWEIEAMIISEKKNNLKMELVHKENETKCVVIYRLNRLKQSLGKFKDSLTKEDSEDFIPNIESTMIYVIVLEPVNTVDVFHAAAINALSEKISISFFQADSLVNDPRQHVLVPKHELVKKEDISALKKFLNIQSVANLPFIRFHQDIQTRLLGAVPGDVIKVTRPSSSSGVETIYRVCVP